MSIPQIVHFRCNPLTIDKSGPVEIMFTRGERLVIESGDERFRPSASGQLRLPSSSSLNSFQLV